MNLIILLLVCLCIIFVIIFFVDIFDFSNSNNEFIKYRIIEERLSGSDLIYFIPEKRKKILGEWNWYPLENTYFCGKRFGKSYTSYLEAENKIKEDEKYTILENKRNEQYKAYKTIHNL